MINFQELLVYSDFLSQADDLNSGQQISLKFGSVFEKFELGLEIAWDGFYTSSFQEGMGSGLKYSLGKYSSGSGDCYGAGQFGSGYGQLGVYMEEFFEKNRYLRAVFGYGCGILSDERESVEPSGQWLRPFGYTWNQLWAFDRERLDGRSLLQTGFIGRIYGSQLITSRLV